ncbi:MAG: hypothetical protein ACM3WU_01815 [Bacillota bacterium]
MWLSAVVLSIAGTLICGALNYCIRRAQLDRTPVEPLPCDTYVDVLGARIHLVVRGCHISLLFTSRRLVRSQLMQVESGHLPHEEEPERFNREAVEFLGM